MFNKIIIGLICMFVLIGCKSKQEIQLKENVAKHEWDLEYFSKVMINEQEFYNCVYEYSLGYNGGTTFSILSNEKCKDRL